QEHKLREEGDGPEAQPIPEAGAPGRAILEGLRDDVLDAKRRSRQRLQHQRREKGRARRNLQQVRVVVEESQDDGIQHGTEHPLGEYALLLTWLSHKLRSARGSLAKSTSPLRRSFQ